MTPTILPITVTRIFTRNLVAAVYVMASYYSSAGLHWVLWLALSWSVRPFCGSRTVPSGICFEAKNGVERAVRIPLAAYCVDSLYEIALEGSTGLFCRADSPASLADTTRLLGNAAFWRGSAAANVARLYDAPVYRARLADLLANLGLPARSAV